VSPDLETGATLGAYRVDSILGRGGMGVVYLARDLRLDRRVALKVLSPDLANDPGFRERFTRESRMAASIDHLNIIPVYEAGDADGVLYLAMRYVEGMDLRDTLIGGGPLSVDRTLDILRQVAAALDTAHTRGLVHRDIKPGNMMIASGAGPESSDHVYLTDFGLTKRTQAETQLTAVGQFVGTIAYAAPEQITGRSVDGRTDQYSLGCVLFECLTGIVPFRRDSDVEVLFAHMSEPPPTLSSVRPDLPEELDRALARAMAKEKGERFATCSEFVAACRAAVRTSVRTEPSAPPPPPTLVGAPLEPVATPGPGFRPDTAGPESPPPPPEAPAVLRVPQPEPSPQAPPRPEPILPARVRDSVRLARALALIGALVLLGAVVFAFLPHYGAETFWNTWGVLSPLESFAVVLAVAWIALALPRGRIRCRPQQDCCWGSGS
jgi:serine/threonine protein kinase